MSAGAKKDVIGNSYCVHAGRAVAVWKQWNAHIQTMFYYTNKWFQKWLPSFLRQLWKELHEEEFELHLSTGKREINRWQANDRMILSFTKHITFRLGPLKPHLERNNSKENITKIGTRSYCVSCAWALCIGKDGYQFTKAHRGAPAPPIVCYGATNKCARECDCLHIFIWPEFLLCLGKYKKNCLWKLRSVVWSRKFRKIMWPAAVVFRIWHHSPEINACIVVFPCHACNEIHVQNKMAGEIRSNFN